MRSWSLAAAMLLLACTEEPGDMTVGDLDRRGDAAVADDASLPGACNSEGAGTLKVEVTIPEGVVADVRVTDADDVLVAGGTLTATTTLSLPAGTYTVSSRRVRASGTIVGPAYQGEVEGADSVCVADAQTVTVRVIYAREVGSEKLWLTNANGEGDILAFDAAALASGGEQTPSVTLDAKVNSPSALSVDARGRLWVGDRAGKLVAFTGDRLGTSSSTGPDIVLEGDALCGEALPCGARAMAFDREGALWVATLKRIVKLAPASLEASGMPVPEVTITSPDLSLPMSLAFDAAGNLWAGDDKEDGVVKFNAARLTANIVDGPADVVLKAQTPPPVIGGLRGPEGLVFDPAGNLWVGYFAGNNLVRFTPADQATSATLTPAVQFTVDVLALVTDLGIDEAGNLWLPGAQGSVYRVDAAELSKPSPALVALRSGVIGSPVRLALHSVEGPLFITE